jgi:hypothetical protein
MVTEVNCNQVDCVPIETLVILLSTSYSETLSGSPAASMLVADQGGSADSTKGSRWVGKILKPMKEVVEEDIYALDLQGVLLSWSRQSLSKNSENHSNQVAAAASEPTETSSRQPSSAPVTVVTMKPRNVAHSAPVTAPRGIEPHRLIPALPQSAARSPADMHGPAAKGPQPAVPMSTMHRAISHTDAIGGRLSTPESSSSSHAERKGGSSRPRGCPCCDPEHLDNIVDRIIFSQLPP